MPNPFDLLESDVVARLKAIPLLARMPMEGSVSGHHKSPHRGSSVEFAEYRNYVPGDDIRRLDWRVFARTDRFYLKEFEAETNLRCHLVVDGSGSMAFAGEGRPKFEVVQRIAACLAHLTIQQGDAAGLNISHSKDAFEAPAKRTPSHVSLILEALSKASPSGETMLTETLTELAEKIRRRALVVIISDLFCDTKALLSCCQHLRFKKHDVAVFHVLDPQEISFEFDRPIRFQDMESSFSLVSEPAMIRDAYLKEFHQYLEQVRGGCMELNVDYRRVITNEPYESAIAGFLRDRAQSMGPL